MTNIKTISIPQACHQSWLQMTTVNEGRHCEHCAKTVVDFTKMSNDEIVAYLSQRTGICGRFEPQQLNSINYNLYAKNLPKANLWKRAAMIISMLTPMSFYKANAQTKPAMVNTGDTTRSANGVRADHFMLGKVAVRNVITISGKVVAKDDGLPIPGAIVKIKGMNTSVLTNIDGKFTINAPAQGSALMISFIGYESQIVPVTDKTLNIVMQMNSSMTGEVVIVRTVPKFKKVWHRVKGKLGVHSELACDSAAVGSSSL
ncbi:MAG: carboxypeptidase-like regulatory domain-containing protein [Mucilaginibacter sp.]